MRNSTKLLSLKYIDGYTENCLVLSPIQFTPPTRTIVQDNLDRRCELGTSYTSDNEPTLAVLVSAADFERTIISVSYTHLTLPTNREV